jgi:hypothetical protein
LISSSIFLVLLLLGRTFRSTCNTLTTSAW